MHDSLYQMKLQKKDTFYECLSDNCNEVFNNTRDRFNHTISQHKFKKNEILEFDSYNNISNVNNNSSKCSLGVPKDICFGENSSFAFNDRKIKIAKRKIS